MVCLADVATTDPRFKSPTHRKTSVVIRLCASVGVVGVCAALAGCSAHERRTAAAPQPIVNPGVAQTALATPGPTGANVPTVAGATSAQTAVQPDDGVKAVVVASKGRAKIGKAGGGLASWYGDRFHGRRTANGERFDMASLTAAHPSFPLPSYVRVTNVSNGRSLVVRVNDRGPFHGGRVIDVSRRAADVLGFRSHGVGTVKLDYVGRAPSSSDDQRLLASYQEFGRPTLPPGAQMAALTPVSDADLAAETGSGGAYQVASRAVARSATSVMASASSAAATAKSAAETTVVTAGNAVRKVLPEREMTTLASSSSTVAPTAYAPPQPLLASVPAEIAAPAAPAASRSKRVVAPGQPALASVAPPLRQSVPATDVSSRIASSFDSFGSSTTIVTGASVRAEATR